MNRTTPQHPELPDRSRGRAWRRLALVLATGVLAAGVAGTGWAADAAKPAAPTKAAAKPAKQPAAQQPAGLNPSEMHGEDLMPSSAKRAGVPNPPRTLTDYVDLEREFQAFLQKNHPIFSVYKKEGRIKGNPKISDREEEFVEFGGGKKYAQVNNRQVAMTYRLGAESMLDFPNNYVGPKKCGECHPAQYEKWERSRHSKMIRFPHEVTEVADLKKPVYPESGSTATILPPGITADQVFAVIGTPRTKYGFLDAWITRGTYHVDDGTLAERTGTLVAGGNQFSRSWAQSLTPEMAKKIAGFVPGFPTKMEDFGPQRSDHWGTNSYGSKFGGDMLFQPGSAYCEVCHTWKFNFKSKQEFYAALGDAKKLQEHTISKGVACEECHGAGGHLVGAVGNRAAGPSNCERCHQRFAWNEEQAKKNPRKPFSPYFKSRFPSCGTEGGQSFNTAHYADGMRCNTCHDPHEVTSNDWRDPYTRPGMKKQCADCHPDQAAFRKQSDIHEKSDCSACHMPVMMSCENFAAIQFPDHGGFDTARTAHVWRIKVDPEAKTLNPPEGKPRDWRGGPWQMARDADGRPSLDLMWTCGRTSWQDRHLKQNMGCHSGAMSKLPAEYQYTDQKVIYERVMAWQKPVKDGVAEVGKALVSLRETLAKSTANAASRGQAQLMINQAQDILVSIEKDGSHGVHAPNFTKQKVDEARTLAAGATAILAGQQKVAAR